VPPLLLAARRPFVASAAAARNFFNTFSLSCVACNISLWFLCASRRPFVPDGLRTTCLHFSVNVFFCVRIFNFPFSDCETRTRETERRVERERHLQSTGSTFVNCFFIFYTGILSEAKNFPRTTQVDELCSALLKQNEKQSIVQKVIDASIKFHCPYLMRDS
jgi:hypothetical protein